MKNASIKVSDLIFGENESKISKTGKIGRNINDTIDPHKNFPKRAILEKILKKESKLVITDSMVVLQDFEKFDFVD